MNSRKLRTRSERNVADRGMVAIRVTGRRGRRSFTRRSPRRRALCHDGIGRSPNDARRRSWRKNRRPSCSTWTAPSIDSVYQHVLAWQDALDQMGIELAVWRIHRKIGMSGGLFANALQRETGQLLTPEEATAAADAARRVLPGSARSSCGRCPVPGPCSRT